MSPEISLLPENLRGKEERETKAKPAPVGEEGGLKMYVPPATAEEDVEIIEVDESELGIILAEEPLLTRLTYQVSATLDSLKDRLFGAKAEVPPPKSPPQFFTPPKSGLVTKPATPGAPPLARGGAAPVPATPGVQPSRPFPPPLASGGAKTKARITPQAEVPKRVRVIRRVRRPVRVSLIPAEEMAFLAVDVGRRKWTLAVLTLLFAAIIGSGYALLTSRLSDARSSLADLNREVDATRSESRKRQTDWSAYQDLQPRLTLLNDLLTQHMVISRVFEFLETRTLPEVSYRSASMTPGGVLTLDVQAASFQSAARQLVAFEKSSLVKKVEATTFNAEQDGTNGAIKQVSFQLMLTLDPAPLRGPLLAQESAATAPSATSTSP